MPAWLRATTFGSAPLAIVPLLLASVLAACSPPRAIESLDLLRDISDPSGEAPADRRPHRYLVEGRPYSGDLYVPTETAEAALVLVPGAARDGKDDPRLVAFASALSRARFLVLVPEIENLRELKIRPEDTTAIGDAVVHLAAIGRPPSVGLVAISYAVGPALIVAVEPRTRDLVGFVTAVGGYFDIESAVTFFTTGYFRESPGHPWQRIDANPYGRWIFLRSNLDRIEDPADRALLEWIADRKLEDPDADIDNLANRLGSEGQSVYALLVNPDPERVPGLISALPEVIRRDMRALDPKATGLSELKARLFLIHGLDDRIIPYTESKALAAAAPESLPDLSLVENLAHVDLSPLGLADFFTLWGAAYRHLELRDEMPKPRLEAIVAPQ